MAVNDLGPVAGNQVSIRPPRANALGALRTWYQGCSTPAANDGTFMDPDAANDLLANLRTLFDQSGIDVDGDDDMLWRSVASGSVRFAVDGGSANAIAASFTPAVRSLGSPFLVAVLRAAANTDVVTFTANATATKQVLRPDGTALAPGDLPAGVALYLWDGTYYRVIAGLATSASAGRTKLAANANYYVNAATGSDSNTGLSAGTAFATIQKAVNVVCDTLDLGGFTVTIHVADGTYPGVTLRKVTGDGTVIIQGNTTTPANCVVATTTQPGCFQQGAGVSAYQVKGFTVTNTGLAASGNGMGLQVSDPGSFLRFEKISFGPCSYAQMSVQHGAEIYCTGAYSLDGGAGSAVAHILVQNGGTFNNTAGAALTITGNPSFSVGFVYARDGYALLRMSSLSISGTVAGRRYYSEANGVIDTYGGGESYLPGNASGVKASGGEYL